MCLSNLGQQLLKQALSARLRPLGKGKHIARKARYLGSRKVSFSRLSFTAFRFWRPYPDTLPCCCPRVTLL